MDWKTMERHPLSADYPDITGTRWQRFVENIRTNGIVGGRRVTTLDGKVLDGWQLFRGCIEADVTPEFQSVPAGVAPETFVETVNDIRRHETQELLEARASRRRQRVVEAKQSGESNRIIAEREGVTETTIRNDVATLRAKGSHVSPPDAKVTDTLGRKQPAAKPPKPDHRCGNCKRKRLDGTSMPGCESCKEERKAAKSGKEPGDSEPKAPKSGKVLFDNRSVKDAIGKLTRLFNERAQKLGLQKSAGWTNVRGKMNELIAAWEAWQKESK